MTIEIKHLPKKMGPKEINPAQGSLDLRVDRQTEIQGIGMGVLSDGTPFLTQRGLARPCGVQNAHIGTIGTEWSDPSQKPRISTVKDLLASRGVSLPSPYIQVMDGGRTLYAYPDTVCLAILEYYAFEAGANCKAEARTNFRHLAGKALQEFIYTQVGYSPAAQIPASWQMFHDRVSRRWMHEVYLRDKFVSYLTTKERQGILPPSFSQIALSAIAAPPTPKLITSG